MILSFTRFTVLGGFMLFLILLSILAPIVSLKAYADNVDGRVYLIVSKALPLHLKNYMLGDIMISMSSPRDFKSYSYNFRDVVGKRLDLDFRDLARQWAEFYKSDIGRRILNSSPTLPTVSITITLYREDRGSVKECIAFYTYSTIDYFIENGLSLNEAIRKAGEDPLGHLRKPLTIILKPVMAKGNISISCTDLSPRIERLKEVLDKKLSLTNISSMDKSLITTQSWCIEEFSETWWTTLYDSKDTPPDGWIENIYHPYGVDIPEEFKRDSWRFYAERYSQAYYYRKDLYNLEIALERTKSKLGADELLYSMDGWIHALFKRLYGISGVQWKDYNEKYGEYGFADYIPYLGIYMENPNEKPIIASGSLAVYRDKYYKHGFSVAGVIFVGEEKVVQILNTIAISVGRTGREYATMWTLFFYDRDTLLIKYDVSEAEKFGCRYWRVIPTSTIMPSYHVFIDPRYLSRTVNPIYLDDVMYSASTDTVYTNTIYDIPAGTILYEDSTYNIAMKYSNGGLASNVFNLIIEMVELTISNLACGENPVCTFFTAVIGDLINYVNEDMENIAMVTYFGVKVETDLDSPTTIQVDKVTLRSSEAYSSIGWRPVMVEYRVYIDTVGGPPPCIEYCPYNIRGKHGSS